MPTTLKRIQISETASVTRALETAAQEWPDVPRSELISRLIVAGATTLAATRDARQADRRRALLQVRGSIAYPDGYLGDLREDWPE
ncbi:MULTISPECIES: hypothetical protein [Gordonia]|jgi:hypothetical protein|uniref:hypothetical protein n=1 Tax=Gordonia TaxID=2053 RepID=UPI0019937CC2|nr:MULTISPECIES: hypothetical protein [Gordonia]MBD0021429.1 hypothetical protein [Gordonia sp. (in: high G+C Gram-positive bacteria)]